MAKDESKRSIKMGNVGGSVGNIVAGDNNILPGTINEAQSKIVAETATEIQQLLEEVSKSYSSDTTSGRMQIATETLSRIENNQTFKARVLSAVKAGGVAALQQLLSHPAASFFIVALEDWQKTQKG